MISAIRYEGLEMPPDAQLPEETIADFEKWIGMGAPDPRDGAAAAQGVDIERAREFWSFRPMNSTLLPKCANKIGRDPT